MRLYDPKLNVKITNDAREYLKLASEHLDRTIIDNFDGLPRPYVNNKPMGQEYIVTLLRKLELMLL